MPSEKDNGRGTPQESRKSSKPIMEKRRRARINASLMELKSLLLEVLKKEGARHNKMEKADILEMTVRHLRQIQRHQFAAAAATDPGVFNKYHTGFNECANEVSRYLSSMDGIDVDLRARLLNYLANSISNLGQTMQQMPASGPATAHVRPMQTTQNLNINMAPSPPKIVSEVNNNCIQNDAFSLQLSQSPRGKDMEGMQLLPNKISTGDLAFVIPTNVLSASGQVPSYVIPIYAGTSLASPLGIPTASLGVAPCPGQSSPATIVSPQGPQIPNIPAHISNVVHIPNNNIEIVSRNMGPMQLRLQSPSSPLQRNANIGSDDKNIADNVHNNPINHGQQADNVAVEDMWRPW